MYGIREKLKTVYRHEKETEARHIPEKKVMFSQNNLNVALVN